MLPLHISRTIAAIVSAVIALATAGILSAAIAPSASAAARPVSVTDATAPAAFVARILPGQHITVTNQCGHGGRFTEFSAYRADGRAMGAQRYNAGHTVTVWHGNHGVVSFDGATFTNATYRSALVMGWCS